MLFLLENLPDALETACRKCSDKQKDTGAKSIKYLYENEPETLKMLLEKYDPNGKYQGLLKYYLASHAG